MAASSYLNSHLFDPGPAQSGRSPAPTTEVAPGRSTLFDVAPYQERTSDPSPTADSTKYHLKGGREANPEHFLNKPYQIPAFMTPREILGKYQVLEGDRDEHWGDGSTGYGSGDYDDSRAGQATHRSERTDYVANETNNYKVRTGDPGYRRPKIEKESGYRMETDDEVWQRKYDEAFDRPVNGQHGWDDARYRNRAGDSTTSPVSYVRHSAGSPKSNYTTGGTWHTGSSAPPATSSFERTHYNEEIDEDDETLGDSIVASGVKSPVRLGETLGQHDMPEVVGGHHRLAVAQFHAPDKLVPVLHYTSLGAAKSDRFYPYT
jgi:hypothetical protein